MYDSPEDDSARSSSSSSGTAQTAPTPHPRAWMDPYIAAVDKKDAWIMKHIKRDGYFDDVCRFPGLTDKIEGFHQKFEAVGLDKRLVLKDGNNELWLE